MSSPCKSSVGGMPPDLDSLYKELWQEVAWLALDWQEYKVLYGDSEKLSLMTATASEFFRSLQRLQLQSVMMQLCRITDKPKSAGKPTLTLLRLEPLIDDAALKLNVDGLIDAARDATTFAREWRNRQGAHCELPARITGLPAIPLPRATSKDFEDAIASITAVMDAVSLHYLDCKTTYRGATNRAGGVGALLYYLKLGYEAERSGNA